MEIPNTIFPIFLVIFIGWLARNRGFIRPEFLGPANRLVFYLAIPAMIFRAISRTSFESQFNLKVLSITIIALVFGYALAWGTGLPAGLRRGKLATFVQSSFHGNLGYIGFAVAYYLCGTEGFARAGIIAGFMMIAQNFLAVVVLSMNNGSAGGRNSIGGMLWKIVGNPVISAAMAGILFSLTHLKLPVIIERSLDIMSGMGLPMALLIIGASLSFGMIRDSLFPVLSSSLIKLLLMPALGLALYRYFGIAGDEYLPGLILLACPTATVSYVMAKEMGGDGDLSTVCISTSTLFSTATFYLWIYISV